MCLVVIAHRVSPEYPLIVAGNRDEFHARPAQAAHWWPDRPDVLGGRDLQAGGSWLAISRNGRFATVTNYRDLEPQAAKPRRTLQSRGDLVTGFLQNDLPPKEYLQTIDGGGYGGFNLLVSDGHALAYLSNRSGACAQLEPGIYGLANESLDTPWPKVERSKSALQTLLETQTVNETQLLRLLEDRTRARSTEVDTTALPFDKAHALTAPFVVLPEYGTRCSTVVLRDGAGNVQLTEKRFTAAGVASGRSEFHYKT